MRLKAWKIEEICLEVCVKSKETTISLLDPLNYQAIAISLTNDQRKELIKLLIDPPVINSLLYKEE